MKEQDLRRVLSALGVEILAKNSRGWLTAQCPLAAYKHTKGYDRHPSFGAKVEEGGLSSFHCYSCKTHGRVRDLVRALGFYRYGDRGYYVELALQADTFDREGYVHKNWDDIEIAEQSQEPLMEEAFEGIYDEIVEGSQAAQYLSSRGVDLSTAESLGLVFDPGQSRILFPVRDAGGDLYGFSGRDIFGVMHPKVRDYAGLKKRLHILGIDRWRKEPGRPVIIVEGLFALAHLVQLNVERVADVGAILGSAMTPYKASLIEGHGAKTFLLFDYDEAGYQGMFGTDSGEGALQMLWQKVPLYIPAWPTGKVDPDDLTKAEVWGMLRDTPQINGPAGVHFEFSSVG